MVIKEAPREIEGAKTVDLGNNYDVKIVMGKPYLDQWPDLIDIATDLDSRWHHSTPELAREMMVRNMSVSDGVKDIEIPSIMLFRRKGVYIGFTTERVFVLPTNTEGEVPLIYVSNRAFAEQYRGKHFGRTAIQIARVMHREATWMGHRTQSEVAAWSVLQADVFSEGRARPWSGLYHEDPEAQELMTGLFYKVRINGLTVNMSTGVSIADYMEPNRANNPRLDHAPTANLRRVMTEEFGMVFERKDSLYVAGLLK